MDCGRGADRSARGRQFHPPAEPRRRQAPPGQHPLGPRHVRRRRSPRAGAAAFRRGGIPCRYGAGGRTHRGRHRAARRADHLRVGSPPRQRRTPPHRRARHRTARRAAHADRGLRHHGHTGNAGLLRHAAQRPAARAHRLLRRLVRRRGHPHGRPAREAATRLRRRRHGLRPDLLAADRLPPHRPDRRKGVDLLQYHAAQAGARDAARTLLRLGMDEPARRGRLDGKAPTRDSGSTPARRRTCFSVRPPTAASA